MKPPTRAMSDWQMYGHRIVCSENKPNLPEGSDGEPVEGSDGEPVKDPERLATWTAVVKDHYEQESEDVKEIVRNALREHMNKVIASKQPMLSLSLDLLMDCLDSFNGWWTLCSIPLDTQS